MAVSLELFIENLTTSGLFSEAELSAFQESLPSERRPGDAQGLARELILAKKLTKYQAAQVYQGKTKGLLFGEYAVLEKIGEGGMAEVFKAMHHRRRQPAAIKVLSAKSLDSPDVLKRFYREVKLATRLDHPNIVATYGAGKQDDVHYLVMEYVEGRDLAALVKRSGPMAPARAVNLVVQAATGLEYAHSQGVVHRDVKPSNLLVDSQGTVKILDMGVARIIKRDDASAGTSLLERLTGTCQVLGTVDYMSPEQARDPRSADQRSDIYSLGCTMYHLLTGKLVYEGISAIMKAIAHCEAEIPRLAESAVEVPDQLDRVFSKMVAKRPEDRYQSMSEVILALRACSRPDRSP